MGPQLLTPRQVAEQLQLGLSTVYQLARRGVIPSVRIGRSVRFSPEAVTAFERRARGPADPAPPARAEATDASPS